jgi:heme/copper-type cytochrome/quinol oxidase subunit 2
MFDNFPLWPTRASTGAGNVDALYIFRLLRSALMCAAIFTMILVFALKYRRRGIQVEQIHWSMIPSGMFLVIFCLGCDHVVSGAPLSGRRE